MKFEIKQRFTEAALFSCEANNIKEAVESAVKSGADLRGADLRGADLRGAKISRAKLVDACLVGSYLGGATLVGSDLRGAYLVGSYLGGATLVGSDLRGAKLVGSYLGGVDLRDATLVDADLRGAYLGDATLVGSDLRGAYLVGGAKAVGERPVFSVYPIGSRKDSLFSYITDKGLLFTAGCKKLVTEDILVDLVKQTHGESNHAKEYLAAIQLCKVHFEIWNDPSKVGV